MAGLIGAGQIVYVHCPAATQRAPLVACAVLLQMKRTLPDAFRLIRSRQALAAMSEADGAVVRELDISRAPFSDVHRT